MKKRVVVYIFVFLLVLNFVSADVIEVLSPGVGDKAPVVTEIPGTDYTVQGATLGENNEINSEKDFTITDGKGKQHRFRKGSNVRIGPNGEITADSITDEKENIHDGVKGIKRNPDGSYDFQEAEKFETDAISADKVEGAKINSDGDVMLIKANAYKLVFSL